MKDPITEVLNSPASFGAGPGIVIADTGTYIGPFHILKALGGNAVINTCAVPKSWQALGLGSLNGQTILGGDTIIIRGMNTLTLTSGTVLAYLESPTPTQGPQ